MEIDFLNITQNFAAFKNGVILPITDYIDADGDDCTADIAVVCIAGDDAHGWFTIEIGPEAERVRLQ